MYSYDMPASMAQADARPTGDGFGKILSSRLIMNKFFLRHSLFSAHLRKAVVSFW